MTLPSRRGSRIGLGAGLAVAIPTAVFALRLSEVGGILLCVSFAVPGLLIAWRRPGQPIAWLLLLMAVGLTLGTAGVTASLGDLLGGTSDMIGQVAAWANGTGWVFVFGGLLGLLLVFPSGRLPGGRWRIVGIALIVAYLPLAAMLLFGPVISVTRVGASTGSDVPNPFALPFLAATSGTPLETTPLWVSLFVLQLIAILALLARFRRSRGLERLQYRWLAWAMVVVAIGNITWALVTIVIRPESPVFAAVIIAVTYPAIPAAVAIAILRYRLYEIDRLVSRTFGWALATGAIVGVFAAGVLAFGALLSDLGQGQALATVAATLLAFALFQPLRSRLQRVVDRRFDRPRIEAERTLERHGERLAHTVELDVIEHDVIDTVAATVRPASAGLWIRPSRRHEALVSPDRPASVVA
jgi:hypothetical protein